MSISLGIYNIIIIFFFLIVPGFIIRRFYFQGEFSKQLSTYSGHLANLVYSFICGLIFTLLYVFVINICKPNTINIEGLLVSFDTNFITDNTSNLGDNTASKFSNFSTNLYKYYLPYLASIYFLSAFIGYIGCRIVLLFGLDTKIKLMRFGNNWHYLFTGRILKHPKFKNSSTTKLKVKYTYLDVLVNENSEKPKLYSGLYADYSLNPKEPSKISEIHLLRPERYTFKEGKAVARPIPGNVFTILSDNILNINCTYVFEKLEEKKHKIYNRKKYTLIILQLFTLCIFGFVFVGLFINKDLVSNHFFNRLSSSSIFIRLIFLLLLNVSIGFVTPFTIDDKKEKLNFIGKKAILNKIILSVILIGLLYFCYCMGWL